MGSRHWQLCQLIFRRGYRQFKLVSTMGMQRPAWTICFCFVWILIVPGVVLTHFSLVKLLPHISDLPQNIVQGFDETFKFAYLEQDSKTVEKAASDALGLCGVNAADVCPTQAYPSSYVPAGRTSDTTAEKAKIVAAFQTSLSIVQKVANDKYLGIDDLKPTANALTKIVNDLEQLKGEMECRNSTVVYCSIYDSAG